MKRLPWWRRPYLAKRLLEIGPGPNPFAGVTHLLERYVSDGHERGGNALLVPTSARLIVGEATILPFAKRAFDFVYASTCSSTWSILTKPAGKSCVWEQLGMSKLHRHFLSRGLPSETSLLRNVGFIGGSCSHRTATDWCSSPSRWRRCLGFAHAGTASFSASFMRRLIFVRPSIVSAGRQRLRSSIGRGSFQVEVRERTVDCQKDSWSAGLPV
jgi:hypothetical protein